MREVIFVERKKFYIKPDMNNLHGKIEHKIAEYIRNTSRPDDTKLIKEVEEAEARIAELRKKGK